MTDTARSEPRAIAAMRSPYAQAGAEAGALALMTFAAVGLLVVSDRRDIAQAMAQDWLAQRGIESSFEVQSIDAGAFTGKMRVGPATNPVFAADHVEVAYDLTAPWAGGPFHLRTRAIRVVHPQLRVTFDGKKFSAGPLDPLISDFLKRPKTKEPGPAVLIENSFTTISTKQGLVRIAGDAALDDGKLLRFDGRLLPTTLKGQDFTLASNGGSLKVRKAGTSLSTDLRLGVERLAAGDIDLHGGQAAVAGVIPYPDPQAQAVAGGTDLRAVIAVDRARLADAAAESFATSVRLVGSLAGGPSNPMFAGAVAGSASVGALSGQGFSARRVKTTFTAPRASLRKGAVALPFVGRLAAGRLEVSDMALADLSAALDGRFNADGKGYLLTANADARGQSGLSPARAQRIARAVPVLSGDPAQARAMAAALERFTLRAESLNLTAHNGDVRLTLASPVTLAGASGGHAVLTPHGQFALIGGKPSAFDLAVSGGGLPDVQAKVASFSAANGVIDANLAIKGAFNAPPAQKAVVSADGRLHMAHGRTVFTLASCADTSAALVDFGDTDVTDASARICPSGGPLVVANDGSWRVRGRFENGKGAIPVWNVAGADASGTFDTMGRGAMDRADIHVAAIRVSDTDKAKRFNPVRASGRAQLAGGVWRGAFPVETGSGRPIADVTLEHVVATGVGHADIDARGLVFAEQGLQPADIAPLGETIRAASGPAAFTGRLDWNKTGSTSSGDLVVTDLAFQSPAGKVTGVNTALHFTSLIPLVTAPGQTIVARHIAAIAPLDDATAVFALDADALRLDTATATLAKGTVALEPLTVPLADGRTVNGVLNLKQVDIGELVAATNLADKVKVDAVLDGRVPFRLGPDGLRFTNGHLVADKPGRISIDRSVLSNVKTGEAAAPANPMDATAPAEQFNAVQDLAYQAMENLAFETLEATVNSTDNGRLGVLFVIHGHHDPKVAREARIGIFDALRGHALDKPVPLPKGTPVNLTLDTSLNFDELLAAWRRGWVDAAKP